MINTIRRIGVDLGARLGLLGPSVLHADTRREFWGKVLHNGFMDDEEAARRLLTSWMERRGASFPLRFVGYRLKDGYHRAPTFADMTIHGFSLDQEEYLEAGLQEPRLIVNLLWSSRQFDNGAIQKMWWCNATPRIPVL